MENSKVDLYVTANAKYFDASSIPLLKTKLQQLGQFLALSMKIAAMNPTDSSVGGIAAPTSKMKFSIIIV